MYISLLISFFKIFILQTWAKFDFSSQGDGK